MEYKHTKRRDSDGNWENVWEPVCKKQSTKRGQCAKATKNKRKRIILPDNPPKPKIGKIIIATVAPIHGIRYDCVGRAFYTVDGRDVAPAVFIGCNEYGTDLMA